MAGGNQKLCDGILAAPGQPGDGADRLPLTKEMQDLGAGLSVQLVHAHEYILDALSVKHKGHL
jgi:hypothetical protein